MTTINPDVRASINIGVGTKIIWIRNLKKYICHSSRSLHSCVNNNNFMHKHYAQFIS